MIIPYIVLWIAILLTLFHRHGSSEIAISLSILLALAVDLIELTALLPLAIVATATIGATFFHHKNTFAFWTLLIATAAACYGLGTHGFSGFNNPLIVENFRISPGAKPFTLYWNYDKACAAYFLILIYQSISGQKPISAVSFQNSAIAFLITLTVTFTVACWFGLISWEPKIPEFLLLWIFSNLFITAASEEAFFRGLIQHQLQQNLASITNNVGVFSIIIAGTVFGIAHIAMGPSYTIVAIIAGIGYGWIFHVSKRIEFSILAHFLLNTIHIIFFTYPMIESV